MDTSVFDSTEDAKIEYLKDSMLGGRVFCLKEPLSSIPKARIQVKMYGDVIESYLMLLT
jgi:hypothetical protein